MGIPTDFRRGLSNNRICLQFEETCDIKIEFINYAEWPRKSFWWQLEHIFDIFKSFLLLKANFALTNFFLSSKHKLFHMIPCHFSRDTSGEFKFKNAPIIWLWSMIFFSRKHSRDRPQNFETLHIQHRYNVIFYCSLRPPWKLSGRITVK